MLLNLLFMLEIVIGWLFFIFFSVLDKKLYLLSLPTTPGNRKTVAIEKLFSAKDKILFSDIFFTDSLLEWTLVVEWLELGYEIKHKKGYG